jgi:quercetin dioxygenase-like cupin family protein
MLRQTAIDRLRAEGLDVTEWRDVAGAIYDEHAHPHREVRVVLAGSMTYVVAGRARELRAGDRLDLEPMQPHSAAVGPQGVHYLSGTER